MVSRIVSVLAATFFSINAVAGELEQLCTGGGYYVGARVHFMSELAQHILHERGELGSAKCTALWQAAFEVGERFSRTGKMKPADSAIFKDVSSFRSKIYSSIAKGAGY